MTNSRRLRPLAPYGFCKLDQEVAVSSWSEESRVKVLVGRYLESVWSRTEPPKEPGIDHPGAATSNRPPATASLRAARHDPRLLVSRGCRTHRCRLPRPLGRGRDPRRASDNDQAHLLAATSDNRHRPCSDAMDHQTCREGRRRCLVKHGAPARDLRMRSHVWTEIDRPPLTPLSHGMRSVYSDLLAAAQDGRIAPAPLVYKHSKDLAGPPVHRRYTSVLRFRSESCSSRLRRRLRSSSTRVHAPGVVRTGAIGNAAARLATNSRDQG